MGSLGGDVSTTPGGLGGSCSNQNLSYYGVRDAALFPGYEVAGIVEALGTEVGPDPNIKVGDKVVVYPYEGVPHG